MPDVPDIIYHYVISIADPGECKSAVGVDFLFHFYAPLCLSQATYYTNENCIAVILNFVLLTSDDYILLYIYYWDCAGSDLNMCL